MTVDEIQQQPDPKGSGCFAFRPVIPSEVEESLTDFMWAF
jgi:hypothetical protein